MLYGASFLINCRPVKNNPRGLAAAFRSRARGVLAWPSSMAGETLSFLNLKQIFAALTVEARCSSCGPSGLMEARGTRAARGASIELPS